MSDDPDATVVRRPPRPPADPDATALGRPATAEPERTTPEPQGADTPSMPPSAEADGSGRVVSPPIPCLESNDLDAAIHLTDLPPQLSGPEADAAPPPWDATALHAPAAVEDLAPSPPLVASRGAAGTAPAFAAASHADVTTDRKSVV